MVKTTATAYAVEVPESAWLRAPKCECQRQTLELVLEGSTWVIRNDSGHCYVLHPDGRATTHTWPTSEESRTPGAIGHWPNPGAAQEALERHLAAGGKLP